METPGPVVEVVAAVLLEGDRVLLAQRTAAQSFPLCWEFPGGKVEPGEGPAEALQRELQEELGLAVSAGEEFALVEDVAPSGTPVRVRFYLARRTGGEPRPVEVAAVAWVRVAELAGWNVIPTNRAVVAKLLGG